MTVEDNLRAGGIAARSAADARRGEAAGPRAVPGPGRTRYQRAGLLSGGEQQMLAIGRALMSGPKLLLLDEPSLGLAPKMVERIGAIIREIHAQGTAVVLVEQNAAMALERRRARGRARGRPGGAGRRRRPRSARAKTCTALPRRARRSQEERRADCDADRLVEVGRMTVTCTSRT